MVTRYEVTSASLTPNPVQAGSGLMIRVSLTATKMTWRGLIRGSWKAVKAYFWERNE